MSASSPNLNNKTIIAFIVCIMLFHMSNNYVILSNDNTPLLWDGGDYFYKSLQYYNVFKEPGPDFISKFNGISTYRPPLLMLLSVPFYHVFGRSTDVAVMTNVLFLIILLLSVYGIGRRLHTKESGLMAAFLVSVFPIIFGLSRSYWQDFPLTAMVSLSIYLLIRTGHFRDRKYSILFGVSAGLGMLTKWTHFIFITGVFLYVFFAPFKSEQGGAQKAGVPALNLLYAVLSAAAFASFWYIPNGLNVATKLLGLSIGVTGSEATRFQQLGETFGPSGIFNLTSFTYYAGKLVNDQISFFFASLFLVFIIVLFKKKMTGKLWICLLWIIVPVIAFTLIKNKTPRNTVPMLPAVAMIISVGIMSINSQWKRKAAALAVIVAGTAQFAVMSYGCSFLPERVALKTPAGDIVFFQQPENPSHAIFRANREDWKADEILDTINSDRGEKETVEIVLLPRDAFTWMAMEYSSYLREMPFKLIGAIETPEAVLSADYVLIKKGGFVAPWFGMENIYRALDLMEENIDEFELIKSVTLPEKWSFIPVYDITSTKSGRKSGVTFIAGLRVIDYNVSEKQNADGRTFTVKATFKGMKHINKELIMAVNVLNRKMEPLIRKPLVPITSHGGLREGEIVTREGSISIPAGIAEKTFGLSVSIIDREKSEPLFYNPAYQIYKRAGTQ